jgi:hypothetical protein
MGRPAADTDARADLDRIEEGPWVRALLSGQQPDGGFAVHPYSKWTGAHWRLVSLVDLGVPPGNARAVAATGGVLQWLGADRDLGSESVVEGRARRHASMEGNALGVCCRLGLAGDRRVQTLAERLVRWQWPDGGWNCDPRPGVRHSSFHETLPALWGLLEHNRATGEAASLEAGRRAADLLLRHRLYRSEGDGSVIHREWIRFHYPPYWHYDVLHALRVLALLPEALSDPRASDALDLLESRRRADGLWATSGRYWWPEGRRGSNVEAVDWGVGGPHPMVTLHALRALTAAVRR